MVLIKMWVLSLILKARLTMIKRDIRNEKLLPLSTMTSGLGVWSMKHLGRDINSFQLNNTSIPTSHTKQAFGKYTYMFETCSVIISNPLSPTLL